MSSRRRAKKELNTAALEVASNVAHGGDHDDIMGSLRIFEGVAGRLGFVQNQLRKTHGGRRNMFHVLGYEATPTFADFWARYQRQDVANRIVNLPVDATWGGGALELEGFPEWAAFEKRLKVTPRLTEVDRLAGIGEYAVMLIGVKEQESDVNDPLKMLEIPVAGLSKLDDIIFLRQYGRNVVEIDKSIQDPSNPRFGLPEFYNIEIATDFANTSEGGGASRAMSRRVHWTRIIHVTSSAMLNEVAGIPRMMPILDRLHDFDKVVGGASEAYWQSADRLFHWNAKGRVGGSAEDRKAMRGEMDEVIHGIATRLLTTSNGELQTIEGRDADPSGLAEVLMTLIASGAGIPKRILFGSERGQLASIQDRDTFADTIANRRTTYAQPCVLNPFIDRLHDWGVAPVGDTVEPVWPEIQVQGAQERAETLDMRMDSILKAEQAAVTGLVVTSDELREELGLKGKGPSARVVSIRPEETMLNETDRDVQDQFRRRAA